MSQTERLPQHMGDVIIASGGSTVVSRSAGASVGQSPASSPLTGPVQTTAKRIWFDQSHDQQRWNWGPIPIIEEHGYRAAKKCAEEAGYVVKALSQKVTNPRDLDCDLLVIVAPFHTYLQPSEIESIAKFVENGKSLLAMSYYSGDPHHQNNLSELGAKFGVEFRTDRVENSIHHHRHPYGILVEDIPQEHEILQGVHRLCLNLTCSLEASEPAKEILFANPDSLTQVADVTDRGIIRSWAATTRTKSPLLAAANCGDGRFAALGTWEVFLSVYMESTEFDNQRLYLNLLRWLTASTFPSSAMAISPAVTTTFSGLNYDLGLRNLRDLFKTQVPALQSVLYTLEARLLGNLDRERRYGSDETIRHERAQIMDELNRLADQAGLVSSFNDLCRE